MSLPRREDNEVDERVSLSLARFASDATVFVELQRWFSKGKHPPKLLTGIGGEELGQQLCLAPGIDRFELWLCYSPESDDTEGVFGSISIQARVTGLVLKAELSVSGKAVLPPPDARPRASSASNVHGRGQQAGSGLGSRSAFSRIKPSQTLLTQCASLGSAPANASVSGAVGDTTTPSQQRSCMDARNCLTCEDTHMQICDQQDLAKTGIPISLPQSGPLSSTQCAGHVWGSLGAPHIMVQPSGPKHRGDDPEPEEQSRHIPALQPSNAPTVERTPCPRGPSRPMAGPPRLHLQLSGSSAPRKATSLPQVDPVGYTTHSKEHCMTPAPLNIAPIPAAGPANGKTAPGASLPGQRSSLKPAAAAGAGAQAQGPLRRPLPATPRHATGPRATGPLAKQELALCAWLNLHLCTSAPDTSKQQQQGSSGEPGTPGSHALTAQRLSAQVQGALWRQCKRNKALHGVIGLVNAKVDAGIFTMTQAPLVADPREVSSLLEPLLCYHPFWLRAGLETILRDTRQPPAAAADAAAPGPRLGAVSRRLFEGDVAQACHGATADASSGIGSVDYTGAAGGREPPAGQRRSLRALLRELLQVEQVAAAADKTACWAKVRGMVLKNVLLLVLLLDVTLSSKEDSGASLVKLPSGTPPLFTRNALKSSKQVLHAFLSKRMHGLGDPCHTLEVWGYRLNHVQQPADEYDYAVNVGLREDLRTGVRLAKLWEEVTGRCHRSGATGPTTDYGNSVAPEAWPEFTTLTVTFVLRFFQVQVVVLGFRTLLHNSEGKLQLWLHPVSDQQCMDNMAKVVAKYQLLGALPALGQRIATQSGPVALRLRDLVEANRDVTLGVLWSIALKWQVSSYLPDWLPLAEVYQPAAPKPEDVAILLEGDEEVDIDTLRAKGWCAVYEAGGCIDDTGLLKSFRDGVRHNFELVNAATARLGRVPRMLAADDVFSGGLEEKTVILFVAHLAQRLLELSVEDRAAHVITQALRRHAWQKKYGPEQRLRAVKVLQCYWRRQLAMRCLAVHKLQASQAAAAAAVAQRCAAATRIQAVWRGLRTRQRQAAMAVAALVLQTRWRACSTRAQYHHSVLLVTQVQSRWRMLAVRKQFLAARQAALSLQRAVRAHQAEKVLALQASAVTTLQAVWRARSERHRFVAARQAATVLQAVWRARQGAKAHQAVRAAAITAQAAWRCRSQQLCHHQLIQAAATLQCAWRARTAASYHKQLHDAAVAVQGAWRAHQARASLAACHAAAITMQAAWRGHRAQASHQLQLRQAVACQSSVRAWLARRMLVAGKQAAIALQAAWRTHQARGRFQRERAARVIQACWRGSRARTQLNVEHAAASCIQAAWRCFVCRAEYHRQRCSLVLLQAAVRSRQAQQAAEARRQAIIAVQVMWRRHLAQLALSSLRAEQKAALTLQAGVRSWLGRRAAASRRRHIITVQACVRGWLARQLVNEMKARGALVLAAKAYMESRWQAAHKLQAWWRGVMVRRQHGNVLLAVRQRRLHSKAAAVIQRAFRAHLQQARYLRQHQALAVITQAVPMFRARMLVLVARRAATTQAAAATVMQSQWRARCAMRAKAVALHNIVRVQALWRGWKVRRNDGRAKAEARRKLTAAAAVAARNPNKTLGARVRDALEQLKSRKDPAQLSQALQSMETGSSYSLACCELIVESRGVAGLLRLMRGLNRSKPHVELLLRMLAVMSHICRHAHLVPAMFASEDCIPTLSERLQFFRDQEDVFMAAMSVVVKLLGPPGHALAVAKMPSVVKTWEGIGQIVSRRIDMERKYIHRLEGQKGSDASAKEATRKLLAAAKQLEAMQAIISQVTHEALLHGVQVEHHNTVPHALSHSALPLGPDTARVPEDVVPAATARTHTWQPKNTVVRNVLRVQQAAQQQAAQQAAQQVMQLVSCQSAASSESTSPDSQTGVKTVPSLPTSTDAMEPSTTTTTTTATVSAATSCAVQVPGLGSTLLGRPRVPGTAAPTGSACTAASRPGAPAQLRGLGAGTGARVAVPVPASGRLGHSSGGQQTPRQSALVGAPKGARSLSGPGAVSATKRQAHQT
ncbi:hypothetical protein QJQ45_006338 [Haematococcus lacustris]|nr:hypothetical protein QJQ45_006338 [Haematococcus lacustris]